MTNDQTRRLRLQTLSAVAVPGLALLAGICLVDGAPVWPPSAGDLPTSASLGLAIEAALAIVLAAGAGALRARPLAALQWFLVLVLTSVAVFGSCLDGADFAIRLAASHAVLLAASAAAFAFGHLASGLWPHPLDAAGAAVAASVAVTIGVLWVGANTTSVSASFANLLLALSPPVSVAAAVNFDVLHTPALYLLSPIAHQQYAYQPWLKAVAVYAVSAPVLWYAASIRRLLR